MEIRIRRKDFATDAEFLASCKALFLRKTITVEHFHPHVKHNAESTMLGFARVKVTDRTDPTDTATYGSIAVKFLKGKMHIDVKEEQSEKDSKWYPIYWFGSAQLRECVLRTIFGDSRVQAAIEVSKQTPAAPAASADQGPATPFDA